MTGSDYAKGITAAIRQESSIHPWPVVCLLPSGDRWLLAALLGAQSAACPNTKRGLNKELYAARHLFCS